MKLSGLAERLKCDTELKDVQNKQIKLCKTLSYRLIFVRSTSFCRTWGEHVVDKNCSECQKQFLSTICSPQVWAWNFDVLNVFNEQSVIILWVSSCKNKNFWQRFTYILFSKNQVWKIKFDKPAKINFEINFCRLLRQQKSSSKYID